MVEAHRTRYRIAVEALAQPAGTRTTFTAQNSQRLADKVRAHLSKLLATQTDTLHDAEAADALATAVHAGIRAAQTEIRLTPVRKLVYAPVSPVLVPWKVRVGDAWRRWNGVAALQDWRALRLLRHNSAAYELQTLLEGDMERFMAQLRTTIAESNSAAMDAVHVTPAVPAAPEPQRGLLKQFTRKFRALIA